MVPFLDRGNKENILSIGHDQHQLSRISPLVRVDEVRVFYDVSGAIVEILAIVAKSEAESWLAQFGSPE